jgi:hypothetical protein
MWQVYTRPTSASDFFFLNTRWPQMPQIFEQTLFPVSFRANCVQGTRYKIICIEKFLLVLNKFQYFMHFCICSVASLKLNENYLKVLKYNMHVCLNTICSRSKEIEIAFTNSGLLLHRRCPLVCGQIPATCNLFLLKENPLSHPFCGHNFLTFFSL